jgi:hypothetical protein
MMGNKSHSTNLRINSLNQLLKGLTFMPQVNENQKMVEVLSQLLNSAETPEEEKAFGTIIEQILCLMKYNRLKRVYKWI